MRRRAASGGRWRTYSKTVNVASSGTPGTYGTAGTIKLNDKGNHLVELKATLSLDLQTTVEMSMGAIRLSSANWNGNLDFHGRGQKGGSDPGTNITPGNLPAEKFPLDIPVSPNTEISVSVAEIFGATETGTIQATVELTYANARPPQAWLDNHAAACGFTQSLRWAGAGVSVAAATTTRTALTTVTIPKWVQCITDVMIPVGVEGAETASQESDGLVEMDYGFSEAGTQEHSFANTRHPELGAAVDKAHDAVCNPSTVNVPLPDSELTARGYITLNSAVTNGRASIGLYGY